jgi:hypothetical protein
VYIHRHRAIFDNFLFKSIFFWQINYINAIFSFWSYNAMLFLLLLKWQFMKDFWKLKVILYFLIFRTWIWAFALLHYDTPFIFFRSNDLVEINIALLLIFGKSFILFYQIFNCLGVKFEVISNELIIWHGLIKLLKKINIFQRLSEMHLILKNLTCSLRHSCLLDCHFLCVFTMRLIFIWLGCLSTFACNTNI